MEKKFSFGLPFFFVICIGSALSSVYFVVNQNPLISLSIPLLVSSIPYFFGVGILDEFDYFSKELFIDQIRFRFLITLGSNPKKIPLVSYLFQLSGVFLFILGIILGTIFLMVDHFSSESYSWSIHSPCTMYWMVLSYSVGILIISIFLRFLSYFMELKRNKKNHSK